MLDIDAARDAAMAEAFRVELGAIVRSASPLLGPMLATAGRTLDEMAARIAPPLGWPRRPRLSAHARAGTLSAHALRHYHATCFPKRPPPQSCASCEIRRSDGDYIMVQAMSHSLELVAHIDHAAWRGRGRGRGWRIVAIEEATAFAGATLVARTGSVDYRVPWARRA